MSVLFEVLLVPSPSPFLYFLTTTKKWILTAFRSPCHWVLYLEAISELSAQPTQWAELKAGRSKIEDRGDRGAGSI